MNKVKVHDKNFRLFIDRNEIQAIIDGLADQISADYKGLDMLMCPVLTGSYMFAADLSRALTIDHEMSFVRFASYQGMQSTGEVKALLDFPKSCQGRHVLIVEDIVDTGATMDFMLNRLRTLEPASVSIGTFFFKPASFKKNFKIDYIGRSIQDDFIVGYGLDYDGLGRSYPDVYILDNE